MNKRLELLSDEVRKGIPIDFGSAIEVIEYQIKLRKTYKESQNKTVLSRVKNLIFNRKESK